MTSFISSTYSPEILSMKQQSQLKNYWNDQKQQVQPDPHPQHQPQHQPQPCTDHIILIESDQPKTWQKTSHCMIL